MKVLFLHENNIEESLGVANLSSVLKSNSHICDVLIQDAEGENFFQKVKEFNPQIIAFSCSTGRHIWANRIAGEIKQSLNVLTVMGGMHPTIYPKEAISEENIDIICIGEGEYPLLELVDNLQRKRNILEIENLWIKEDKKIHKNPLRALNDVNALPYPDRDVYYKYLYNRNITAKRFISSLGCPFRCSFCQNPLLMTLYKGKGVFVRRKKTDRIVKEISRMKNRYPLELVHFSDDIFALDKDWLKEFSPLYKRKISLPFNCNIRISCLDEETVKLLKDAGCYGVTFGLESGNEFLRNKILLKDSTNKDMLEKTVILKKYGIKILTSNMIALPHENISDVYETIKLNRKIGVDYVRVFMTKPFKGTELFKYGEKNHLLHNRAFSEDHFEDLTNIYFRINSENEFKNLRYLFFLILKFPILEKFSRLLIKLPFEKFYKFLFSITTAIQEQQFYRVNVFKGVFLALRLAKGVGKYF